MDDSAPVVVANEGPSDCWALSFNAIGGLAHIGPSQGSRGGGCGGRRGGHRRGRGARGSGGGGGGEVARPRLSNREQQPSWEGWRIFEISKIRLPGRSRWSRVGSSGSVVTHLTRAAPQQPVAIALLVGRNASVGQS